MKHQRDRDIRTIKQAFTFAVADGTLGWSLICSYAYDIAVYPGCDLKMTVTKARESINYDGPWPERPFLLKYTKWT